MLLTRAAVQGYVLRAGGSRVVSWEGIGAAILAGQASVPLLVPCCVKPIWHRASCQQALTFTCMKRKLTFTSATDRLAAIGISLGAVAEQFGVRRETVSRWRREGGDFPPPENWREVLAGLAEEKGGELRDLARELQADSPAA